MSGWFDDPQTEHPPMPEARDRRLRAVKFVDTTPHARERANKSGTYEPQLIMEIASRAKEAGVDPYKALAIAMQETNLGKPYREGWPDPNPFHVDLKQHDVEPEEAFDKAFALMQQHQQRYKDPLTAIQAHQGLGYTHPRTYQGGRYKKLFGSRKPINMGKEKTYGKQVMALMEALARTPGVAELVNRSEVAPLDYGR